MSWRNTVCTGKGFATADSIVLGKLRIADLLVLGEIQSRPEGETLALTIVRSASGATEKVAAARGRLPEDLDAMVNAAVNGIAQKATGMGPSATGRDVFPLAVDPEAIESFYRGLASSAQGHPLRAAPHFAQAFGRDNRFVLAKLRERRCYEIAGLPRLFSAVDLQFKKLDTGLAAPSAEAGESSHPTLLLNVPTELTDARPGIGGLPPCNQ